MNVQVEKMGDSKSDYKRKRLKGGRRAVIKRFPERTGCALTETVRPHCATQECAGPFDGRRKSSQSQTRGGGIQLLFLEIQKDGRRKKTL